MKTYSPLIPTQNPITTIASTHDILLFLSWSAPSRSPSHLDNSAFTMSEVTPKYCLFMTPTLNLDHIMNSPNHGPLVRNAFYVKFFPYREKIVSPIPNVTSTHKIAHAVGDFLMLSQ